MIDPAKKPFRCKYIFRERYVTRVEPPAPAPPVPDLHKIKRGLSFAAMDAIVKRRAAQ